jgi:hypothetical protein
MVMVTAQMSVSLGGFFSGPRDLDAGFHRVTRWVIDTLAWRERMGFKGRQGQRVIGLGHRRPRPRHPPHWPY